MNAPILRKVLAAVLGALLANASPAAAAVLPLPVAPPADKLVEFVAADCYAIGQRVAAQQGGQLAKASPDTQGGQPVCRIVVLLPGKDGQRPRRAEIVVPAN